MKYTRDYHSQHGTAVKLIENEIAIFARGYEVFVKKVITNKSSSSSLSSRWTSLKRSNKETRCIVAIEGKLIGESKCHFTLVGIYHVELFIVDLISMTLMSDINVIEISPIRLGRVLYASYKDTTIELCHAHGQITEIEVVNNKDGGDCSYLYDGAITNRSPAQDHFYCASTTKLNSRSFSIGGTAFGCVFLWNRAGRLWKLRPHLGAVYSVALLAYPDRPNKLIVATSSDDRSAWVGIITLNEAGDEIICLKSIHRTTLLRGRVWSVMPHFKNGVLRMIVGGEDSRILRWNCDNSMIEAGDIVMADMKGTYKIPWNTKSCGSSEFINGMGTGYRCCDISQDAILVGTEEGSCLILPEYEQRHCKWSYEKIPNEIVPTDVRAITFENKHQLLLASRHGGLQRINIATKSSVDLLPQSYSVMGLKPLSDTESIGWTVDNIILHINENCIRKYDLKDYSEYISVMRMPLLLLLLLLLCPLRYIP